MTLPQFHHLEGWPEIKARHKRERIQLLTSVLNHYSMKNAAIILGTKEGTLRSFAYNNYINYEKGECFSTS
tara:strand:+ start:2383 stop:2595 length:213 start_codon:yes stop_codon:yes gene_type:complete